MRKIKYMIIVFKIFYIFLIIYFIYFIVFWTGFKFTIMFRGSRKIVNYLCLSHSWAVFSDPYKVNKSLLLTIEYDDGKKELINLFDCENFIFLNRKANSFDRRYVSDLPHLLELRTIFAYYIKNNIEKEKNKKIKKIEFIEKIKKIKLWESNFDPAVFVKISSHNF